MEISAEIGGRSGVVACIPFSVSSSCALAFWVSMLPASVSSPRSSKTLRAGVGGSKVSLVSGASDPAREGARVEFAREREGPISCKPSAIVDAVVARLFRHFCDKDGNRVPSREVNPTEEKSLALCRFTTGFIAKSRSLAPSARS